MLKNLRSFSTSLAVNTMLVLGVASLALSFDAVAQTPSGAHGKTTGIPEKKSDGTWESLKAGQQKILAPLESDWDYMLPDSRKKWIQVANLYPKMSEADQQRLQSRMASWSNLSQKDRRLARENYLSSLKFPAEKKAEAWSAYQKLSDEQKKKLAQTEINKKKPTAVNAPTLQQHVLTQKSNLALTLPASSAPTPEASAPNTSSDSSTSNP
jgi:hypothetical protein